MIRQVGAPEDPIPGFSCFSLLQKEIKIGGSAIGSPEDIREMLKLAVEKDVHPWIQTRPLKDANQAVVDMEKGLAKYRYVLVNEAHSK